ncbi:MAG: CPBP family intramembrane metalloprotease [Bacteroidales bacterium]|nr:CPBP family intramembrane metalloprotease [Bacteroidales bacterium]
MALIFDVVVKRVFVTIVIATVLWSVMFSPITAPYVNFWWVMTGSALILTGLATIFGGAWWKQIKFSFKELVLGAAIAVLLWSLFWVGDKLSQLLFNFARGQVDLIYSIKEGESALLLTLLMLFIIGPAEEIFWRGYVQKSLSGRWGANMGFVVTTAVYTLVHAGSCNFMLTMAAMVAGLVWGALYRFYPVHFPAIIISHALWDAAVFIWFPI